MARPDTGVDGGEEPADGARPNTGVVRPGDVVRPNTDVVRPGDVVRPNTDVVRPGDVVRPNTDVVRPGDVVRPNTDVVRPGTGVVRPGTGVVAPVDSAKASAAVPDAPEKPLEPIQVVLPVIPVKPVKQGFLDRLVAPKEKKQKKDSKKEKKREEDEAAQSPPAETPAAADQVTKTVPSSPAPSSPAPSAAAAPPAPAPAPPAPPKAAPAPPKAPPKPPAPPDQPPPAPPSPPAQPAPAPAKAAPPPPTPSAPPRPAQAAPPAAPPRPGPAAPPRTQPGPRAPEAPRPAPPARPPVRPAPERRRPEFDRRAVERRRAPDWDEYDDWGERRRPKPVRKGLWTAVVVVALALSSGGGAFAGMTARRPEAPRWLGAAAVGAPSPVLASLNGEAERPSAAGVAARISSLLADGRLGGRVTASVVDVATGDVLYERNADSLAVPASTAKLLTAAAVLQARGPDYRIPTRAVAGSSPGEVVLVGGGDPTLAAGSPATYAGAARLDKLAEQVKAGLGDVAPTRVIVDSTLYVGSTLGPGWFPQDAKDGFIGNITALMTDGARRNPKQVKPPASRYPQPDLAAGQLFAKALGLPASAATFGRAEPDAQELGQVFSPPISRLVEIMIADSDNMIAEALARQVALAKGEPASFDGGAAATRDALGELGLPLDGYGLVDGSGLSHQNKVTARLLTDLLVAAASDDHPELRPIVSGLPVAAYSGTLVDRYRSANAGGAAAGVVRAKTGTLNGVSSLAGLAVDANGRLLAFAVVADAAGNTFQAESALDRVAAAIASCGCS